MTNFKQNYECLDCSFNWWAQKITECPDCKSPQTIQVNYGQKFEQPTEEEIQEAAREYCKSIGSSITGAAYSAYMACFCKLQKYQAQQPNIIDKLEKDKCSCGQCDKCFYKANKKWYEAQQPEKQVRSAEEIVNDIKPFHNWRTGGMIEQKIIEAMHEYASQFQTPAIGISEGSDDVYCPDWDCKCKSADQCKFKESSQPQPNAIRVIEERVKELEGKLNEEKSKKFDDPLSMESCVSENVTSMLAFAIVDYDTILTKLKKQP